MIELKTGGLNEIVVVGAHCDDIAIGMGGTLLTLTQADPDVRVRGLVLSGGGGDREVEERNALAAFCSGADVELTVLDVPDGRAPAQWDRIKNSLRDFARSCDAQVVFGPQRADAHQDHRVLSELTWNTFRDHFILEYEIPKYDGDFGRPNVFVSLDADICRAKTRHLMESFASQRSKHWFDEETFLGLMRLRGMECNSKSRYAEAFYCRKMTL